MGLLEHVGGPDGLFIWKVVIGGCNHLNEAISSFERPGRWAFFPPGLCLYYVDLEITSPLVPHFLHVQSRLGAAPANSCSPINVFLPVSNHPQGI